MKKIKTPRIVCGALCKWLIFSALFILFLWALVSPVSAHAATTPTLNSSASYGILSSTYTDTSAATTVNGDIGFTTPPATAIGGTHTSFGSGAPYSSAGTDQGAVLGLLNAQSCDFTFGSAQDLSLLVQPLTPGVYCVTGAQSVGTGGISLTSGTYIFRSTGALNTVANSVVSGGDACDVFWTPVATTLGANSTFFGTVIDDAGITVGAVTTWVGRALSFGGTVTTDTDTISVPSCSVVVPVVTQTEAATTTPSETATTAVLVEVAATTTPVVAVATTATTTVASATTTDVLLLSSLPNTGLGVDDWLFNLRYVLIISAIIAFSFAFIAVGFVL